MFGLSFGELIIICIVALVVIGPEQLPKVARTLGRLLNEFKRATGDFTESFGSLKNQTTRTLEDGLKEVKKQFGVDDLSSIGKEIKEDVQKVSKELKEEVKDSLQPANELSEKNLDRPLEKKKDE